MAIAFDSSGATAQNTSSATTVAIDITAAATGATCYAAFNARARTTVTTPAGWTLVLAVQYDNAGTPTSALAVFSRVKIAGDTTFTVTYGTADRSVIAWTSYTGVNTTTPNSTASYLAHTSGTALATNSVSNSFTNGWAVVFNAVASSSALDTVAPDAALTERKEQGGNTTSDYSDIEIADSNGIVTVAAHSYSSTISLSESHAGTCLIYLNPLVASTNHGGFMDFFPI